MADQDIRAVVPAEPVTRSTPGLPAPDSYGSDGWPEWHPDGTGRMVTAGWGDDGEPLVFADPTGLMDAAQAHRFGLAVLAAVAHVTPVAAASGGAAAAGMVREWLDDLVIERDLRDDRTRDAAEGADHD